MKRTPLQRRTPLRRQSWFRHNDDKPERSLVARVVDEREKSELQKRAEQKRRSRSRTKYATRERGWSYMAWVKTLPCMLIATGKCEGPTEADHAGDRGLGRKSRDAECVPLCTRHHRERTDLRGYFAAFDAATMRQWRHDVIATVQATATAYGVTIPDA